MIKYNSVESRSPPQGGALKETRQHASGGIFSHSNKKRPAGKPKTIGFKLPGSQLRAHSTEEEGLGFEEESHEQKEEDESPGLP